MKIYFVFCVCLFLLMSEVVVSQNYNYKDIKEGYFLNKNLPDVSIKRTKRKQIESNKKEGYKMIFTVEWESDSTFFLILKREKAQEKGCLSKGDKIYVKITEVSEMSYRWIAYNQKCGGMVQGEYEIVK